jgi:hypothetical protein
MAAEFCSCCKRVVLATVNGVRVCCVCDVAGHWPVVVKR